MPEQQPFQQFLADLSGFDGLIDQSVATRSAYSFDGGGLCFGMPGVVIFPKNTGDIRIILKSANKNKVPVFVRGGGITTEGETVASNQVLIDMKKMHRIIKIDPSNRWAEIEAGAYFHDIYEELRPFGLTYKSAPLNMTATLGGTISTGGLDVNATKYGCTADQILELELVTPDGEIHVLSPKHESDLFYSVLYGYGLFGIITKAKIELIPYSDIHFVPLYYTNLAKVCEDMLFLIDQKASDYICILSTLDRVFVLLAAFEDSQLLIKFEKNYRRQLRGSSEFFTGLRLAAYYALNPWNLTEALFLLKRRKSIVPALLDPLYTSNASIMKHRTVCFARLIWRFWGEKYVIIPDITFAPRHLYRAAKEGLKICKRHFKRFTLYCIFTKRVNDSRAYEFSPFPVGFDSYMGGIEFTAMPSIDAGPQKELVQQFKDSIYSLGLELGGRAYRFGGSMKKHTKSILGGFFEKYKRLKFELDPNMILNPGIIFDRKEQPLPTNEPN